MPARLRQTGWPTASTSARPRCRRRPGSEPTLPSMRMLALACAVLVAGCTPIGLQPAAKATPAPATGLQAFVPVAERYVEQHRGLKFKQQVKVSFLSEADFKSRLASTSRLDTKAIATEAKVLEAL